MTLSYK